MNKTIDLISRNTRLMNRFGMLVIPDGETYIHVDGVRKLKLDKMAKCSYAHGIPDTPQFKGLNGETDVTVSYAPHTYYLELPPGYRVMSGGTTVQYPSMGICTGGSPTTIQMGAHLFIGFVFGVDRVSGSQTELCGADVWSEDGVSIPITCASGIIDPCKGVVCNPVCVGVDRYATVCKNGVCVRGTRIEANSTTCGYVAPVCTEGEKRGKMTCWDGTVIYGEVCRGNKWVPTGRECTEEPTDPCKGVVCNPVCVGVDRYATKCMDGKCVRGALMEANSSKCGYVKPECSEGDKKPGYICSEGKWVPYTPEQEAGRLYVKFAIPWLDMLPGIPYEPWMIIPPGFKIVEGSR